MGQGVGDPSLAQKFPMKIYLLSFSINIFISSSILPLITFPRMMRGMRAALLDLQVVVTGGEETQRNWMGVIQEIEPIVMNQVVRVVLWKCSCCVGFLA